VVLSLKREHEHERRPWLNGGGATAELVSLPPGVGPGADFAWRLSMAEIAESGPFSRFEGVDRLIVLVDGPPMVLRFPDRDQLLQRFEPFGFDGEDDVVCEVAGPCRDLNVMTRRGRASAAVGVVRVGGDPVAVAAADPLVVVTLDGALSITAGAVTGRLGPGDLAVTDDRIVLGGEGHAAVVRIAAGETA